MWKRFFLSVSFGFLVFLTSTSGVNAVCTKTGPLDVTAVSGCSTLPLNQCISGGDYIWCGSCAPNSLGIDTAACYYWTADCGTCTDALPNTTTNSCGAPRESVISINGGPFTTSDVSITWGDTITWGAAANGGYVTSNLIRAADNFVGSICSNHPTYYGAPCPNTTVMDNLWYGGPGATIKVESFEPIGTFDGPAGNCADRLNVFVNSCTAPGAVTLVGPANGSTVGGSNTNLTWNPDAGWPTCSNSKQYKVYVSTTNPPTTVTATVNSPSSGYVFTGTIGQTYYWKVRANNGFDGPDSPVWSFTLANAPWWQFSGGGATAVGDLYSKLPSGKSLDNSAVGKAPGIVVVGGVLNLNGGLASIYNLQAAPAGIGSRLSSENSWAETKNRLLSYVTPTTITTPLTAVDVVNWPKQDGVYYVQVVGDLAVSGLDVGTNRVVVLVTGNANINSNVNLTDGSGYLAILASGNITVDPSVGYTTAADPATLAPNLEGVYFANGTFDTGTGAKQLRVDGSAIGMTGVTLARTLFSTWPAEYFFFRPDIYMNTPRGLQSRSMLWQEVSP